MHHSARLWPFWAGCRTAGWRSAGRRRRRLEPDPRHQAPRHRRAVDRGREPAIVGHPVRRAAHPRQHLGEDLLEQPAVDRHDDAARHGEGLGRAQPHGRHHALGRAPLQRLVAQPAPVPPQQAPDDQPDHPVPALHPPEREARPAHRLQDQGLVRAGPEPRRPGVAVDRPRVARPGGVDRQIERERQLVETLGGQRPARGEPEVARLLQEGGPGEGVHRFRVVVRADRPQVTVAGQDLLAAHLGHAASPCLPRRTLRDDAMTVQPHLPEPLAAWMGPFLAGLTRPTGRHALALVAGAILAPGRRTVAAVLRVVGLGQVPTFTDYHRVLNRNRWAGRAAAARLLHPLLAAFVPDGPVVIGIDETIERRWGARIKARGIYRDPVRSSRGHFVKASGLRWITVMLLAPIPWAGRVRALPFLAALAPSARFARERGRRHKRLTDRARQLLLLVARWLPGRRLVAVADSSYAAIELLAAVCRRLTVLTRLRPDARLFDPPPPRRPGTRRRRRVSGARPPPPGAPPGAPPGGARGRPGDPLAAGHGRGLVRPDRAADRARLGHGALASPGQAGPGPLALGPRCRRRIRAAGLRVHRPGRRSARRAALVRAALVGRGDVRRGAPTPRGGDAAAVVGPGDRAHHAGAARPVLAGDALGRGRRRSAPRCRLVPQTPAHLQRRARHRSLPSLDLGDFPHLTGRR